MQRVATAVTGRKKNLLSTSRSLEKKYHFTRGEVENHRVKTKCEETRRSPVRHITGCLFTVFAASQRGDF